MRDPEDDELVVSLGSPSGVVAPNFVVGTPSVVNAALASLIYTPSADYSGPTFIDLHVDDGPHAVDRQYAFEVTEAPPVVPVPALPRLALLLAALAILASAGSLRVARR